jgi:hypothetical protein
MSINEELLHRAREYAARYGLSLANELGSGVHGIVFLAIAKAEKARCAVKIHSQEEAFRRERDIYLRLKERGVKRIRECEVPQFIRFDDEFRVIEMTIVSRPFVLDFAGAYLDKAPTFPEEVWADWRAEKAEQFGAHWPEVQAILAVLQGYGVFMEDVNPGNIAFPD